MAKKIIIFTDINIVDSKIVTEATQGSSQDATDKIKSEKNPASIALGRLGGLKGSKARAEKLTSKTQKEIAKKAAKARWVKNQ